MIGDIQIIILNINIDKKNANIIVDIVKCLNINQYNDVIYWGNIYIGINHTIFNTWFAVVY